jgi:hypothetical protein
MLTNSVRQRIFLLSPANISGVRAAQIMNPGAVSDLAIRLRDGGAPLGEVFSFMSGLYFRGKLAYARAFSRAPVGVPSALVITACGGLVAAETLLTLERLRQISTGAIDLGNSQYRQPLVRDAQNLFKLVGSNCEIILLGSVATDKYTKPLLEIFGEKLFFPAEFIGRGDMSRGGLMLRCVSADAQLSYVPVANATLHGSRLPRLPRLSPAVLGKN